jgi:hypothetical protein
VHGATVVAILPDGIHRRLADRHNSLTTPLPKESDASVFKIRSVKIQCDDLTHPSTRSVKGLTKRVRTLRICARKVACALLSCKLPKQSLHVVEAQHCREVAARPWKIDLCAD